MAKRALKARCRVASYDGCGGLTGPFSKRKGWSTDSVNDFISDCVSVIEQVASISHARAGIRPVSATALLKDFKKAAIENPDLGTVEHLCATQCVSTCFGYGNHIGAETYELFFDQGEPFYGHICDRWKNRKSRKADKIWNQVINIAEADMRHVPALQAADLLAWSINHAHQENTLRFQWQERVVEVERDSYLFDYEELQDASLEKIELVKSWKLPQRKRPR